MPDNQLFRIRKVLLIPLVLLLLILVLVLVFRDGFTTLGKVLGVVPPSEQQVLDKLMQHSEMQIYAGWDYEANHLSQDDIKNLLKSQPVIYGGISGDVYKFTFKSKGSGLLVLYDYDKDVIEKKFDILDVQFA